MTAATGADTAGAAGVNPAPAARPAAGSVPAIELIGIEKRFGPVLANRDVSLRVAAGSIHGIVG